MRMFHETMTLLSSPEGHELFFKVKISEISIKRPELTDSIKAKEEEFSACKVYQFTVPIFGKDVVYDASPEVLVEQRKCVVKFDSIK